MHIFKLTDEMRCIQNKLFSEPSEGNFFCCCALVYLYINCIDLKKIKYMTENNPTLPPPPSGTDAGCRAACAQKR